MLTWCVAVLREAVLCNVEVTDIRTQREMGTYRGHNRDVTCASWHPLHEDLFASGGYDGSLLYWLVSSPNPQVRPRGFLVCGTDPFRMLAVVTCVHMGAEVECGICGRLLDPIL